MNTRKDKIYRQGCVSHPLNFLFIDFLDFSRYNSLRALPMLLYTSRDRPTDLNTLVLILLDLDILNLHELNTTSAHQVLFDLPYAA
jgi:hypothetical protein